MALDKVGWYGAEVIVMRLLTVSDVGEFGYDYWLVMYLVMFWRSVSAKIIDRGGPGVHYLKQCKVIIIWVSGMQRKREKGTIYCIECEYNDFCRVTTVKIHYSLMSFPVSRAHCLFHMDFLIELMLQSFAFTCEDMWMSGYHAVNRYTKPCTRL